jgi:hypothetical protein
LVAITLFVLEQTRVLDSYQGSLIGFPNTKSSTFVLAQGRPASESEPSSFGSHAMQDPESDDHARERREEFIRRRLPDGGIRSPEPGTPDSANQSEDKKKDPPREQPIEDLK